MTRNGPAWVRQAFADKPLIDFDELVRAAPFGRDFLREAVRNGTLPYARKGRGGQRVHRLFGPGHIETFLKTLQQGKTAQSQ